MSKAGLVAESITMTKRLFTALIISVMFHGEVHAEEVRDLRVWAGPDNTRAVLDLSGRVNYRLFELANPARVVIDIDDATLSGDLALDPKASGILSDVRHGERDGDNLRIVFDLESKSQPKSFLLAPAGDYGHRLVVDLPVNSGSAARSPIKSASDFAQEKDRDVIIAVDAGHGGEDPGAIGKSKTHEKRITLAIARDLAAAINKEPGMRAILIRDGDYYIPLEARFEKARQHRADLFVSIHADAFNDRRVHGSSVYILSRRGASSEAARRLAEKENRSDLIGGVTLTDKDNMLASVLMDLSQNATLEASDHVARQIFGSLKAVGKTHKNRVESANFVVLRSPDVPSVLVETAFISNPSEEKRLNDPKHRKKLANAILGGIRSHFRSMPPQGTWMASHRSNPTYTVARGDTLSGIAARYQVSVASIRKENNLRSNRIQVGTQLKIPAS